MICLQCHQCQTSEREVLRYKWLIMTDMLQNKSLCYNENMYEFSSIFCNRFNTAFLLNPMTCLLMLNSYVNKESVPIPFKIWAIPKFNQVSKGKNVITLLKFAVNISHLYEKQRDVSEQQLDNIPNCNP